MASLMYVDCDSSCAEYIQLTDQLVVDLCKGSGYFSDAHIEALSDLMERRVGVIFARKAKRPVGWLMPTGVTEMLEMCARV